MPLWAWIIFLVVAWSIALGALVFLQKIWTATDVKPEFARKGRTLLPSTIGVIAIIAASTLPWIRTECWIIIAVSLVWNGSIRRYGRPRWSIPPVCRDSVHRTA